MKTAILAGIVVLPAFPAFPAFPVLPSVLCAQSITAAGRVLRPDSMPVLGSRVVLHQVGRAVQGPLDSTTSGRGGRFRFSFRPDTSVLYLLSARHAGIEYFSPPVHTNPDRPDTGIRIIVHDTSSTGPVSLEARHLVITRPGEDGTRGVLDLLVLRNDGRLTRVARDSLRPSWAGPLPRGTLGLELGEGDLSPDAISRRNDSLIVTAPLAPGEKQLTVEYLIPADRENLDLSFTEPVSVNVLAEEKDAQVSGAGLTFADSQTIEGRSFRRWTGQVPAGGSLRVVFPAARGASQRALTALVAAMMLGLAAAGWYILARRQVQPVRDSPDELIGAIAALDVKYQDRERELPPTEWGAYQAERARLKGLLEASLAAGRANQ